ncbi:MAG: S8 family serine peptidase [Candidatus Sericytochromatia bacterium]|nr:S8 family serine peptidase [Candidatus Sericytochromatia bacterium]
MRRFPTPALLGLAIALSLPACGQRPTPLAQAAATGATVAQRADGRSEWLVKVAPQADLAGLDVLDRDLAALGWLTVAQPAGISASEARRRLTRLPGVLDAQPNHVYGLDTPVSVTAQAPRLPGLLQGDPELGRQYHLNLIHAPQAWAVTRGSRQVRLALLDTGVDPAHPELRDRLDPEVGLYNAVMRNKDVRDGHGHGTHTAGIALASLDNGAGGAGVAPGVSLMGIQVLSSNGNGTTKSIATGFLYAANNGARVINASLAVYRRDKVLEAAIQQALDRDVCIVASAGNVGKENDPETAPHLPSTYPGVIEVAATDAQDRVASFSNFGKTVSVAAPGVDVWSTFPTKNGIPGYGLASGTSMAAPCAAGVVALIRSQHPDWKRAQVKAHLEARAQDLGLAGFDPRFGHGRIDAGRAVAL